MTRGMLTELTSSWRLTSEAAAPKATAKIA